MLMDGPMDQILIHEATKRWSLRSVLEARLRNVAFCEDVLQYVHSKHPVNGPLAQQRKCSPLGPS